MYSYRHRNIGKRRREDPLHIAVHFVKCLQIDNILVLKVVTIDKDECIISDNYCLRIQV